MKTLVYRLRTDTNAPKLEWYRNAGNLSISFEVREVSTNNIIYRKENTHLGRIVSEETANLTPGIYEANYHTQNESASEFFVVGNPDSVLQTLLAKLSMHDTTPQAKLNIDAQARRARILLSKDNYNSGNKKWGEKLAYTFSSLANIEHSLENGVVNIAKDRPGLHIRGFISKIDGSSQFYRFYAPSNYRPGAPLPLLVMVSTRVAKARPFVAGPVMANQREALLWAHYAEKYGFALLWPGYRSAPEGYSYESMHIDEAIQAVEQDYAVDKSRISAYATCGAGYNAGRLVSEYPNLFASIVYDRAVFNLVPPDKDDDVPSLAKWLKDVNPVNHVLANRNLKIFVMHDNTAPSGHGQMALTTQFLDQAKTTRTDVISSLSKQSMKMARMDTVFSWITPCRNASPSDTRFHAESKAGYTGPISEIFTTPILVVKGTHALGRDLQNSNSVAESIRKNYIKHFHGAQCAVKNDDDVTKDDIDNYSLILIGNPRTNSVWNKLQPDLAIKMTSTGVMYKNDTLAGNSAFEAIAAHPYVANKYVLMIGAWDLRSLRIPSSTLFTAWYDGLVLTSPNKIIGKLNDINN